MLPQRSIYTVFMRCSNSERGRGGIFRKYESPTSSASLKELNIHRIGPFGQVYVVVNLDTLCAYQKALWFIFRDLHGVCSMFLLLSKNKTKACFHVFLKQGLSYTSYQIKTLICFQELKHFVSEIIQQIWKHQWYPQCNSTTPQAFRNHESDVSLQKKNHTIDFKLCT